MGYENVMEPDGELCSSTNILGSILRNRGIVINQDGICFKVGYVTEYRIKIMKLIVLMVSAIISHIIKGIPYHHVTILGSGVYSEVVSNCLTKHNVSYIVCRRIGKKSYYEIDNGIEIPFEGTSPYYFDFIESPIIPHTNEELLELENHTGLSGLDQIQDEILEKFSAQDGVHIFTQNIINQWGNNIQIRSGSPIHIAKFTENLYFVMIDGHIWLSHTIISEQASELQRGDHISCLYGDIIQECGTEYNIVRTPESCIVYDPYNMTTITRRVNYRVENNLSIHMINSNNENEAIIYSLENPREFRSKSMYMIHPFHLPCTYDPFLTIMIITLALTR